MLDYLDLITREEHRQNEEICLIASENICSKAIRIAQGSCFTNKYSEGYPGKRYYRGNSVVDEVETTAIELAKKLFKCSFANVQPHSGSQANQAVYLALLEPGDTILGMDLNAGGHLTHGSKVSASGKIYNAVSYGLDSNGLINYEEIKEKLYQYHPRLLMVGASAYSRLIDYEKIRKMVDDYNKDKPLSIEREKVDTESRSIYNWTETIDKCYLVVDMAHIAGLVAADVVPSPIPYADVVTTTTHKTLRGPRGGLILTNDKELAKKIDKAVFPGIQGGPLDHIILGKAICFDEALQPEFKEYSSQILENIKAMEKIFKEENINMVSGGSDNHLILIDLRNEGISGRTLEEELEKCGIIVNRNAIVNDPLPKSETSGIRIGTANITTRGFKAKDCELLASIIASIIHLLKTNFGIDYEAVKKKVNFLTLNCPIWKI